jgi:hypothetical protein
MTDDRFEPILRALLAGDAPTTVPVTLRNHAWAIPDSSSPGSGAGTRWRLLAAIATGIGAVVLVGLGVALLAAARPTPPFPGTGAQGGNAVRWSSGLVTLSADDFAIVANGRTFLGRPPYAIHSDPGDANYRTLELTWFERGVEMRMNLYVEADARDWWLSELRTYDGHEPGDWITYGGPLFRTPRGLPFRGTVELTSAGGPLGDASKGSVRFKNLVLDAMPVQQELQRAVDRLLGEPCSPAIDPTGPDASADPLAPGQPLAGSRIEGMSPEAAERLLRSRGLCRSWRFQYRTDDQGNGYGERWCEPPPGEIRNLAYGSSGEVILFVETPGDPILPLRSQPPIGWGC